MLPLHRVTEFQKFPTKETEKIDTRYPYAVTKYLAEEMIIYWSKIYNLKYISLRLLMFTELDQEHQVLMEQCLEYF